MSALTLGSVHPRSTHTSPSQLNQGQGAHNIPVVSKQRGNPLDENIAKKRYQNRNISGRPGMCDPI